VCDLEIRRPWPKINKLVNLPGDRT
jgi:hypothetical protein